MATVLQHPFGTTAFGEFLRSAREKRGLTIQQIAHETKIPRRLLESLEHGDLGAVPSGMYQRAEIRAYAKAVGLDQSLALSELARALETRIGDVDRHAGPPREAEGWRQRPFLAAACAIAIAVIGLVTWFGRITPQATDDRRAAARAVEGPPAQPPTGAAEVPAVSAADAGAAKAPVAVKAKAPIGGADQPPPRLRRSAEASAQAEAPPPQQQLEATGRTEPAEAAPPQAGLITQLVVVSDPPGARVIVDGIGRGTTPVTIRYLTAGEKRVRVLKDGFPAQERTVRLAPAREPTTVSIPLTTAAQ